MAKYEIMLVVDGDLPEKTAREEIANLTTLFADSENFSEKVNWSETLAYEIKKKKVGHRFLFNFETNNIALINEFNRLVLFNKAVLRHLVINLEKEYGYKTTINPKKVKSSEIRRDKFLKYIEEKQKQQEAYELENAKNASVKEAKLREITDYSKLDKKEKSVSDEAPAALENEEKSEE